MTASLRPDEKTSQARIEKSKSLDSMAGKGVKTAVGLGVGAATLGAGARLMPFLNDLIPTDLAIKGISKVNPQVGKFLHKGMSQGLDVKDGIRFVKDQFGIGSESPAKDDRSIIEQYSPELNQAIMELVQSGEDPVVASMKIQNTGKFSKAIRDIEKDHKTTFGSIVKSIFGGGQMTTSPQGKAALQPQQAQGGTNSDQALLAALEKILTM